MKRKVKRKPKRKRKARITTEDVVLAMMARRLADIEFENAILRERQP